MLARMKKPLTEEITIICLTEQGVVLNLPRSIARNLTKYEVQDSKLIKKFKTRIKKSIAIEPEEIFAEINDKYGKANALVKAIRLREGMTQIEFAAAINIMQGDLSKIESGKRSIGKEIAQRISKKFGVNPNLLLQL